MSWPAPLSLSFQFDVLPLCGNGIAWGQEDSRTDCECGGGCRGVCTHSKDPVQTSKSWHRGRSHGSRPLTMCVPSAGSPVSLLSLVPVSDGMIRATFKSCQPNCLSPCGSSQSLTATERSPPERQLTLPRSSSVLYYIASSSALAILLEGAPSDGCRLYKQSTMMSSGLFALCSSAKSLSWEASSTNSNSLLISHLIFPHKKRLICGEFSKRKAHPHTTSCSSCFYFGCGYVVKQAPNQMSS